MERYESLTPINKGRQIELDIARGLAVFFMVLIHVQEYFLVDYQSESLIGSIIGFLGGVPAAPVFMFLMGIGIVYSKKNDPKKSLYRGVLLIAIGYLLNFMRGSLPNLYHWAIWAEPQFLEKALNEFIYVDIFQFSGLAMIFMAWVKKVNLNNRLLLLVLVVFGGMNFLTRDIESANLFISAISGLFIGSNAFSFFPFLSWIFYPIAGYLFGKFLIQCQDKNKFYLKVFIGASFVCVALYVIFSTYLGLDIGLSTDYSYYHHQLLGNVIFTAFVLGWISVLFFISKGLPKKIENVLSRWSKNVSEIYFIHWIYIGWLGTLVGLNQLEMPYLAILILIVLMSSDWISEWYLLKKRYDS